MDTVVARAGMWFTLLVIAIVAVAGAHDTGFAVHMWIVAGVAGIGLWASVARVDYQAIAQGILRSPADPGRYDDEPIRWGVLMVINVWMTIAGKLREEAPMSDAKYDPEADRPIVAVPAE